MNATYKAEELLVKYKDPYKAWSHANKQYDKSLDSGNEVKQDFWSAVASYIFGKYPSLIRNRLATRTRAR